MKPAIRSILYALLVLFMLLSFYGIFNAGNPHSVFRLLIRDPAYDIALTMGLSLLVVVLAILLTTGRRNGLSRLLEINRDHVRKLRDQGMSDDSIAESLLQALGGRRGILPSLAKRRILRYLSRLE